MAAGGYITTLLGGLTADSRRVLTRVFEYFVENNELGPIEHQTKLTNFKGYYVQSTTSSTADDEFSVQHGIGRTPYLLVPVLPLDDTTAKIVRLQVSRPADAQRVYLRSPEVSAPISLWIEG